ncbi:GAF domain-containing protein [bacterium]|nr:GAF domain-containing protein [bacterium]
MAKTTKSSAQIYRQILIIFILLLVLIEGSLYLFEFWKKRAKEQKLLTQSYIACSSILTAIASGYSNVFPHYSDEMNKLVRSLLRSFTVYSWNKTKWEPSFVWGRELFHKDYLTRQFSPSSFSEEFERYGEMWVWRKNRENISDIRHPDIVCAYEHNGQFYLLTAEFSPTLVELIVMPGIASRNRAMTVGILGALILSIAIVMLFHKSISRQFGKITAFLHSDSSEPPVLWEDFAPLISEVERIRRQQQELRFEFEREASLIAVKSEARLRSLSLLREIASIGNSVTDDHILMHRILEKLNRFFNTYAAAAFITRPDGKVDIITTDNMPSEFIDEVSTLIAPDSAELMKRRVDKVGFVFLEEAKFVTQESKLEKIAQKSGVIGYIRIPLIQRGEFLGGIHLYSLRVFPNDETFEKLLKGLGEEISVAIENRRLYNDLEQRLKESMALYEISKVLISAVDYDLLLEQILWIVQESFGFAATTILLLDEEHNELYVKVSWGFQTDIMNTRIPVGKGITGWVASTGQPLIIPDVKHDPRFIPTDMDVKSEMAVPLIVGGKIIGVLDVESKEVNRFSERDLWFLSSLAAQASLAIDRAKLYQQIREQAIRDPLTKTYNRRFCDDYVQNQARETLLKGMPVSIIMVDINGLKRVNDTYGHSSGDILLVEIADFLKENFPDNPIARYGGDEFIVFLLGLSQWELDEIVSNLRKLKTRWQIKMSEKHPFPLDFAIGAATATRPDELELLIDYADNLMYKDKHGLS